MDKDVPRAHHDLGGVPKFLCEAVDVEPHALTDFDKEVDALSRVLARSDSRPWTRGVVGSRRFPRRSTRLSYYGRWIRSITYNLWRRA